MPTSSTAAAVAVQPVTVTRAAAPASRPVVALPASLSAVPAAEKRKEIVREEIVEVVIVKPKEIHLSDVGIEYVAPRVEAPAKTQAQAKAEAHAVRERSKSQDFSVGASVRVIADFSMDKRNVLAIRTNDVGTVVSAPLHKGKPKSTPAGWIYSSINGKVGLVPLSYIEAKTTPQAPVPSVTAVPTAAPVVSAPAASPAHQPLVSSQSLLIARVELPRTGLNVISQMKQPASSAELHPGMIVLAVSAYDSNSRRILSFAKGESITVLRMRSRGFALC